MRFFSSLIALFSPAIFGQQAPNSQPCPCDCSSVTASVATASELCSIPRSCIASRTVSASETSIEAVLESRFYAQDPVESCNVEAFCRRNAPGAYCYTPVGEMIGRNKCKCLKAAFVQCPFGVLNVCKRGFVCGQSADSLGIMTATCTRLATATIQPRQIVTTSLVPTSLMAVTPSSTLIVINSTVYNEGATVAQVVPTSIPFTLDIQYRFSSVYTLVTTVTTEAVQSVPITLAPKALATLTVANCASVSSFSVPKYFTEAGIASVVCRGSYANAAPEPYVIKCIESVNSSSVTSGLTSGSTMGSTSESRSALTSMTSSMIPSTLTSLYSSPPLSLSTQTSTLTPISEFPFTMSPTITSTLTFPTTVTSATAPFITTINGEIRTIYPAGAPVTSMEPPLTTFYPFAP